MKSTLKTICLVPVLLAVAVAPLLAQADNGPDNKPAPSAQAASNAATSDNSSTSSPEKVAAVPPVPPMPPMPAMPQVTINPNGIYVGGGQGSMASSSGPNDIEALLGLVAILSPFICIMVVCALIFESRRRRNKMLHETIRAMIEKGVPIPPELLTSPGPLRRRREKSDLRSGLVMLAIGFGVMVMFSAMHSHAWALGFIFVLIGGALLITWKLEKKDALSSEVAPR
jgi:Domain of unknown function (DUF6249)